LRFTAVVDIGVEWFSFGKEWVAEIAEGASVAKSVASDWQRFPLM